MQLIFKTSVLQYNIPVFYSVFKTSDNEYLAETSATGMVPFSIKKESGEWVSNGGKHSSHVRAIANLIDIHYQDN